MSNEMDDNLPPLTHLQFLVIDIIGTGEMSGKDLREALAEEKVWKTGPAFYQMMSRLEESKMVEGWYEQQIIEGQIIKERRYKVLGNGFAAHKRTKNFYAARRTLGRPAFNLGGAV
jgi:hypothetical protein